MGTRIYFFVMAGFLFFIGIFQTGGQTVLTLQPGPEDGIDAPLISIHPDSNYGNDPSDMCCAWTFGGDFGIDRSLLKFDLTQIPSSAIIINAKLSLFYFQGYATGHAGDNASYLQKVTENWDEMAVTWNNQPFATSLGEVDLPASLYQMQDYPDIDITRFVSDWVADPQHNFGMLLRIADESVFRSMLFGSSDNPDASLRPKLVVTYKICTAPVAHFAYSVLGSDVQFHDSSTSAQTWYWSFGDGYFSNLKNPSHNYTQFGKYYTCLSVTDSCGTSQSCDTIYVCRQPDPRFSYVTHGHLVSFTDSSYSSESWYWSFGDDFFSDLQNPTHYFKDPGTYYVCLTSKNICNQQTFCDSVLFQTNGVNNLSRESFSIYPVPASDHINIVSSGLQPGPGEINIINEAGAVIFRKHINGTSRGFFDSIDLAGFSPGFYYLRMIASHATFLKKFVVIKTF